MLGGVNNKKTKLDDSIPNSFEIAKNVDLSLEGHPNGKAVNIGPFVKQLFSIDLENFFIRSCYPKLYEKIHREREKFVNHIVTGTPGIGKSFFLLYVLIKRIQEGHPVCFHNLSTRMTFYFANNECISGNSRTSSPLLWQMIEDNHSKELDLLLDGAKGNPTEYPRVRGVSLLASSPRYTNYSEFKKRSGIFYYMPVWTLSELNHYNVSMSINIDGNLLAERFSEIGGVVRALFTEKLYANHFGLLRGQLASKKYFIKLMWQYDPGLELLQDDDRDKEYVSDKVIHYTVSDQFEMNFLCFCSKRAFDYYITKLESPTPVDLLFDWRDGKGYEIAVLTAITCCSQVLVSDLPSTGSSFKPWKLQWQQGSICIVKELSNEEIDDYLKSKPQSPLVIVPKSLNYPAFDGFLYDGSKWCPIQVTIDSKKQLKPDLLRSFWDKHQNNLGVSNLEIYVIAPPSDAIREKYTFENKNHKEDNIKWAREKVVQKVIPFPRPDDPPMHFDSAAVELLKEMKHEIFTRITKRNYTHTDGNNLVTNLNALNIVSHNIIQ